MFRKWVEVAFSGRLRWLFSDFVRFLKKPNQQLELWKDLINTNTKATFLRNEGGGRPGNREALIVSLSDNPFQIKVEAIFALALRIAGYKIKVLNRNKNDRWAIRYFKSFGIQENVFWNDIQLTPQELKEVKKAHAKFSSFVNSGQNFEEVKKWEFRGCRIGTQILSSAGRGFRTAGLDLSNPETQEEIKEITKTSLETVFKSERLIRSEAPDLMYVMEANYSQNGAITDVATQRNIDFIQVCQVGQDNALILRRLNSRNRRQHPWSITKENLKKYSEEPLTIEEKEKLNKIFENRYNGTSFLQSRNHPKSQKKSYDQIISQFNFDPCKKIAVVYSHVLWDANLFYGDDLFADYGEWFVETVKAAIKNDSINWLIKLHPANVWKRKREGASEELSELRLINKHICKPENIPSHVKLLMPDCDIGTVSLREVADYAVTVRGSVAVEFPPLGIPVVTAGTGRASNFGFTVDSTTRKEYIEKLHTLQSIPKLSQKQINDAECYAYTVLNCRPWILKSFACNYMKSGSGSHPLESNILINAKNWDEIKQNGDLCKISRWISNRDEVDFFENNR